MDFDISSQADKRLRELYEQQGSKGGLRVAVKGGGCSGMSYSLDWSEQKDKDHVFRREENSVLVFIDPRSLLFLKGSTLIFVNMLEYSGFKISNPNAKNTCGCGESFSV